MNIEGAMVHGETLRLFGRGNGAAREGEVARNATCELDAPAFLAWLRAPCAPREQIFERAATAPVSAKANAEAIDLDQLLRRTARLVPRPSHRRAL